MNTMITTTINKAKKMISPRRIAGLLGKIGDSRAQKNAEVKLDKRILVGTHHKTGTIWMINVFNNICRELNLEFYSGDQDKIMNDYNVFFQSHSKFHLDRIRSEYRGLHMIRDPRDRIISGCFYHQKSSEKWLHIKSDEFGGMTYQEKINSYESADDKILFEMEHSGRRGIQEMLDWDYDNPNFIEVKYEDLILDNNLMLFHEIFNFLEFPGVVIPDILRISYDNSLFSGNLKQSIHIRSGKTSQWEAHFTPEHKARFLELFDNALIKLGYESNNDWALS